MEETAGTPQELASSRLQRITAAGTAFSGLIVLLGWTLDVRAFRMPLGGPFAMNPVTSLAFVFAGVSLYLTGRPRARALSSLLAIMVVAAGLARWLSAASLLEARADSYLFGARIATNGGLAVNGMAPNTATNLMLVGLALLAANVGGRARRVADMLAMASAVLVMIPIADSVFRLDALHRMVWFVPMALNTALTFLSLDAGISSVAPVGGLARLLADPANGGILARRLMPAAFTVPIALGALCMAGFRAGLFTLPTAVVIFAASTSILTAGIVWYTADHVARIERDREEAEGARGLLASLVESSDDAIIGADLHGITQSWNPGAQRLYGYSEKEVLGRELTFLLPPGVPTVAGQVYARLGRGERLTEFERPHRRKDGSCLTVSLTLSPVLDAGGVPCGFVMTARDITERKRAAQEIAALNESLRHRSEQLETVNRELEAFSYSVSHDLRAPLRHIHGFGDLLTRHAATVLDEKGKRYLATITSSATSMGRLIDDLLVFSRMGRSQLQKTAVPLGPLVADVRVGLEMETKDRRIDFRIGELPTIEGDPTMLRVVFMNLLQNAIKYTGTREAARIEVEATETNGEHVISVRDNGVGFDMEYVHKLFGVFQRLHSDEEFEGTGIGLANVRRVVQRHGGRTWAEGKLDAGATFYVTFPAMRTERTAEVVNAGAEANPAG